MYGHARIQACTGMYAPGAPAETAVRCLTGHGGQGGDDGGGAGGQRVGGVDRGRRGDGNEEIGGPDGDVAEVGYGGGGGGGGIGAGAMESGYDRLKQAAPSSRMLASALRSGWHVPENCVICQQAPPAFLPLCPAKHCSVCSNCYERCVQKNITRCPICRDNFGLNHSSGDTRGQGGRQ